MDFRQGQGIFLFATASRPALESTKPPFQWLSWDLSLGVKRPGREPDHSLPSNTEVKNASSLISINPLGPIQPSIQWVPSPLSPGVKWPGREADHISI
jgi:hypothetical protein